jgi:polysaccharide transporter, PST family
MVRSQIIAEFGLVSAGIYEALWRLSTINQLIFSTTLLVYVLPRMSQMVGGPAFRRFYIQSLAGATMMAAVMMLAEYLLRVPLFHILFTAEFEPAADYFGYQAAGDVARVITLVTATAMIAKSRAGAFIALEAIRFAAFVAASAYLIPLYGQQAPAFAHMVAYTLSAVIGVAMMLLAGNESETASTGEG